MPDTTFEEAKRCPKCQEPGRDTGATRRVQNGLLHTIECVNPRCKWFKQPGWQVQVNYDGTIPQATMDREKFFNKLPERSQESIDRQMQSILDQQL